MSFLGAVNMARLINFPFLTWPVSQYGTQQLAGILVHLCKKNKHKGFFYYLIGKSEKIISEYSDKGSAEEKNAYLFHYLTGFRT